MYVGKILEKGKKLSDYNIQRNATLFENKRIQGGEDEDVYCELLDCRYDPDEKEINIYTFRTLTFYIINLFFCCCKVKFDKEGKLNEDKSSKWATKWSF